MQDIDLVDELDKELDNDWDEDSECYMSDEELDMYKSIFSDPDFLYEFMLVDFGEEE